jgi:hypothetical protein
VQNSTEFRGKNTQNFGVKIHGIPKEIPELLYFGTMETWRHRDVETWRHGDMETLRHGDTETWRHGNMETWRHGNKETWRNSDMGTWIHEYGDIET